MRPLPFHPSYMLDFVFLCYFSLFFSAFSWLWQIMSAICQLAFIIISACTITRQQHLQLYRNCCWSPDWSKYATNSASTKGRQTFSERIVVKVFDETDQCVWYLRRTLQSAMHWHLNSVAPTIAERLAVILSQSRGKKASLKILQHSQWQLNLRHSKHTRKAFAATLVESALKILWVTVFAKDINGQIDKM